MGAGKMRKILVMNGPNLNMLGIREPGVYGKGTLADLEEQVRSHADRRGVKVKFFQSNSEGKLIKRIHEALGAFDGIVYNPGAHTHYSYAIRDAIGSVDVPCVEVHISDVDAREAFRHVSVTAPACVAQVKGLGFQGYCAAIDLLLDGACTRLGEGYENRYPAAKVIIGMPEEACVGEGEGDGVASEERAGAEDDSDDADSSDEAAELDDVDGAGEAVLDAEAESVLDEVSVLIAAALDAMTPADSGPAGDPRAQKMRIGSLRDAMAAEGMAAFCVRDTSNIRWACAFDGVFDEEAAHALIVTPDRVVLHTDSRYEEACRRAAHGTAIEIDASRVAHAKALANVVGIVDAEELAASGVATSPDTVALAAAEPVMVGIEDGISLSEYRRFERALQGAVLWETDGLVVGLRAVKDEDEITRMRIAQAITDAAFMHIVSFMRPGMTERDVQIELEDFMIRHGAEGLAFSSIVAAGVNGASPHAISGATRLEAGQCVVLDFGARALGYCSDMTRTVFLGEPTNKMRAAYDTIRRANEEVEALLRPGVTGAEAHELAERVLAEGGFAGCMGHGLGHGVGIDIHEQPTLSPRNPAPLAVGNVVTVEPGIYLPGEFGMRLEDFGVITETGFDVFTCSSHDMVVL